jgi:hypothetical protein
MSIGMNQSKELNPSKSLTIKVKPKRNLKYLPTYLILPIYLPTYLPTYLVPPTHLNMDFSLFLPKIQKFHVAYWHYAMFHNLKPLKINDEDPPSICKTKVFQTFFICDMSLCKLLIFMVIYKWHTIVYRW